MYVYIVTDCYMVKKELKSYYWILVFSSKHAVCVCLYEREMNKMCVVHLYLLFYGYGYDLADTSVPSKLLLLYLISLRSTHTVTICATFYVYHWYCTNFKSVCTGMYIVSFYLSFFLSFFFWRNDWFGEEKEGPNCKEDLGGKPKSEPYS